MDLMNKNDKQQFWIIFIAGAICLAIVGTLGWYILKGIDWIAEEVQEVELDLEITAGEGLEGM